PFIFYKEIDTRYLYLLIRFKLLALSSLFINTPFFGRKRMQKYNLFQNRQNIFFKILHTKTLLRWKTMIYIKNFFAE
ncbi:MAG: hypothetical protein IK058_05165, partial [Bacteroidales bacterium]|nr:hypothetical protein [Bacteroidales bacterium]